MSESELTPNATPAARRRPISLTKWSLRTHADRESALRQLVHAKLVKNAGKCARIRASRSLHTIKIGIPHAVHHGACVLMTSVDFAHGSATIANFSPHRGSCGSRFTPTQFMDIVDVIARGLSLRTIHLEDRAMVHICRHNKPDRSVDYSNVFGVPLSAVLRILTEGGSYYERFGFRPVDPDDERYNTHMDVMLSPPAQVRTFARLPHRHQRRVVLGACLRLYDNLTCNASPVVTSWLIEELNRVPIPEHYVKTYHV